jgi:membrane protein implicated in regulation of membrane protease activity
MNGDWLRWYSLLYWLPAAVAVLILLLSGLEGGSEGEPADPGADAGEWGGALQQSLAFLGTGHSPLMVVLGSLMLGWGLVGLAANAILQPLLGSRFMLPSLVLAAAGSLLAARLVAVLARRFLPQEESFAVSRQQLVGHPGKAIYPVSEGAGRIHVRDRFRTLHTLAARVAPGEPPIEKGTDVIIASMDAARRYVIVEPLGFSVTKK